MAGEKVVINLATGLEDTERVTVAFLVATAALDHGKQVAFVGVDLRDDRGSASRLLKTVPLSYPSYEDPDGKVYNGYRLQGTPSTIFYDASGKQTFLHSGPYFHQADLDADIRRYALGESTRS